MAEITESGASEGLATLLRVRRAIVIADVVNSVQLLQVQEEGYLAHWRTLVRSTRSDVLAARGGRFVKSLGDGMLLEFESPAEAVLAAVDILRLAHAQGDASQGVAIIALRIGINVADVLSDELDIYGDGVNLAARLAGLGEPGDIVVSEAVRDELAGGMDLDVVDMGLCFVKHYAEPVRAFRVRKESGAACIASIATNDLRLTIAVLPFFPAARSPEADALGLALADDVIAAFSQRRDLRVISRLSTQALAGAGPADPSVVASRLGAAYLVAGSVEFGPAVALVRVSLCDTSTGEILWADRIRFGVPALFLGRDECIPRIVAEVSRAVLSCELQRAKRLPMSSLSCFSLYTGSIGLLHRLRRADFEKSRQLLERLTELEPRSAAPHALLAKWHLMHMAQGWATDASQTAARVSHHVQRALDRDAEHALALSLLAHFMAQMQRDLAGGQATVEQAFGADPQEPNAWLIAAGIASYRGDGTRAILCARRAIDLSPLDPARFLFDVFLAAALTVAARYEEAALAAESSVRGNALHPASRRISVIALALAGRVEEAREAGQALLQLDPGFRVSNFAARYPGQGLPHAALQAEALRVAGLPA
jgi:adenylate cyclase